MTAALVEKIKQSFPTRPIPENVGVSSEAFYVDAFFNGREWPAVTVESLNTIGRHEDGLGDISAFLSFMNDEGFCYYLPAYMLMNLLEWSEDTRWLYEYLISHLIPKPYRWPHTPLENTSTAEITDTDFLEKIKRLTPEQKSCIAAFLKHQISHLGPTPVSFINTNALTAYNAYWHQFASPEADNN